MKAAYITAYGGADKVKIGEQPKPKALSGQVLIKMKAASVNPIDWKTVNGDLKALFKPPFPLMLGSDGAGVVERIGAGVSEFKIGDEVFFRCHKMDTGTFAEYFAVPADLVALKPKNMSFNEAASIPLVGLTVTQSLYEKAGMVKGSKVLIHAGAGGVGTFAIQYAKAKGAAVATTASKKRNELLLGLGADEIIDYHSTKIEDVLSGYDIVLDTLGESVHEASYKTLKKGGVLVTVLGIPDNEVIADYGANFIIKIVAKLHNSKMRKSAAKYGASYKHHLMYASGTQLTEIAKLIEEGKIKAIIDSTYPLDQVQAAFARSMTGRAQGKIIITMG
jgi:NADPH:quinone reductase-like Zn-dependent oxidoreductase